MRTSAPFATQAVLISNPVRSLQAIAAKTRILRRPPAASIRPALSIPNSVVPLAVSLWQRQPSPSPAIDRAEASPAPAIAVQRTNRFEISRTAEGGEPCQQLRKRSLKQARGNVYQVCVRDRVVAEFPSQSQAEAMAKRLHQSLRADRRGDDLQLKLIDGVPTGLIDETVLFTVDSRTARAIGRNRDLIAIEWTNQLRLALNAEPLSLADAQIQLYGLSSQPQGELNGLASWYGPYFHGRLTAAGEIFDQNELTAAHPSLPFDTFLQVTNQETGKSVIVRINDRGPYVGTRSLDLSRQAAQLIGSEHSGVVNYEAVILEPQPVVAQARPSAAAPEGSEAIALNRMR